MSSASGSVFDAAGLAVASAPRPTPREKRSLLAVFMPRSMLQESLTRARRGTDGAIRGSSGYGRQTEEGQGHDLVKPRGRLDDEGDRVDDAADRRAVAVEAAGDDEVDGRVALDLDSVRRAFDADGHREIERHADLVARLDDRNLVEPEHVARRHAVGLDLRENGLDCLLDRVDRESQPQRDQRRRFGEADVAELLRRDAGRELGTGQARADFGAQRPAALGGIHDAGDLDALDRDAGARGLEREAVHDEAGIDAGAEDRDALRLGALVDLARERGVGKLGVRELLA